MAIKIPEGSIEIQKGLWAEKKVLSFKGKEVTKYNLYSEEGHCFWDKTIRENFDEEGKLKPPSERIYYRTMYTCYHTVDEINADIVSVQIEDGFEVA